MLRSFFGAEERRSLNNSPQRPRQKYLPTKPTFADEVLERCYFALPGRVVFNVAFEADFFVEFRVLVARAGFVFLREFA